MPGRTPEKIILDCDPGHDDAVAILLAHGSPDIDLLAVTTVVGNQTLAKVTRNALVVAQVAGIVDVPFAAGADRPLLRQVQTAPTIHGNTGMDGPEQPEPTLQLDPRHAVDLIIDTVMAHESRTITLVATAGLTNIALAARKEPRIIERVKRVVLMGGAVAAGNWSPVAEFNIVIDPEAAAIVFSAGWDVTMVGLDLTHQALATPDVVARVAEIGTSPARFVGELFDFFTQAYRDAQGFDYPPVHDPCAVAHVIDPTIVRATRMPIAVETTGTLTLGMTVADRRAPATADCKTSAALDLDRERFWDLIIDALHRIGEPDLSGAASVGGGPR